MGIKVIAIGNRVMGDDGVGIEVAEYLREFFIENGLEVIIGETDIGYSLSHINAGDFVIILDASYKGGNIGDISVMSLREAMSRREKFYTQHQPSLIKWLYIYKIKVTGVVIGIEVKDVCLKLGLSHGIKEIFPQICMEVKKIIQWILEEEYYA